MHRNSTWYFKLLGSKMSKTNRPESCGHPASPWHSHCKYSLIYTLLSLCHTLHFLHALLLTCFLDILGLFRLCDYFFFFYYSFYIENVLIMVLPVNSGNISLSCTIYSQLSVLASGILCVCVYIYMSCIPYLLFPIGEACLVHLFVHCLIPDKSSQAAECRGHRFLFQPMRNSKWSEWTVSPWPFKQVELSPPAVFVTVPVVWREPRPTRNSM